MSDARLCLPYGMRPAAPEDAAALAFLINEAGEGFPEFFWSRNEAGQDKWEYGAMRAAREDGDFSYRNAHVVEENGRVVAMLLGFVVQEAEVELEKVDPLVRPLVVLEQRAQGSWYVNALAVRPECRSAGIGSRLLGLAHALALLAGCEQVSLQNFTCNHRARSLYQRLGFKEVAREPMARELIGAHGLPDFGDSILHKMDVDESQALPFLAPEN